MLDLDKDFTQEVIELPDDYEGKVTAVLIKAKSNTGNRNSVLYIHGFTDYFFQAHMAEQFLNAGIDFYALDLRKYGRALLPHQHPNYCRSMYEYFPEITFSISQIKQQNPDNIILMGHSTGGLTASLYMNDGENRHLVNALILNSPFFDFNISKIERFFLPAMSALRAGLSKYSKVDGALTRVYPHSIYKGSHGEWDFNTRWKPIEGFPAYYAWIKAVSRAQKRIRRHSEIKVPVLVLHSHKSLRLKAYTPEAKTADTVLDIGDIVKTGSKLGKNVYLKSIENGLHDLVLSQKNVRTKVFEIIFDWLNAIL